MVARRLEHRSSLRCRVWVAEVHWSTNHWQLVAAVQMMMEPAGLEHGDEGAASATVADYSWWDSWRQPVHMSAGEAGKRHPQGHRGCWSLQVCHKRGMQLAVEQRQVVRSCKQVRGPEQPEQPWMCSQQVLLSLR